MCEKYISHYYFLFRFIPDFISIIWLYTDLEVRCSLVFKMSETLQKSIKSNLFIPNKGCFLKKGIIILLITEILDICSWALLSVRLNFFAKCEIFLKISRNSL